MTYTRRACSIAGVLLFCIASSTPAGAFERHSDDMADVGATLTVLSGIGLGIAAGMTLGSGDGDPDLLPMAAVMSMSSTLVGSIGVPLWIVGAGPNEDVPQYLGDVEPRSNAMGAMGIIMTAGGVGTLAGTLAVATDVGSGGGLAGLGAAFISAVGLPTGAALLTMGIPLIVKGFHQEPEVPRAVPTFAAGPGSLTASWRF